MFGQDDIGNEIRQLLKQKSPDLLAQRRAWPQIPNPYVPPYESDKEKMYREHAFQRSEDQRLREKYGALTPRQPPPPQEGPGGRAEKEKQNRICTLLTEQSQPVPESQANSDILGAPSSASSQYQDENSLNANVYEAYLRMRQYQDTANPADPDYPRRAAELQAAYNAARDRNHGAFNRSTYKR